MNGSGKLECIDLGSPIIGGAGGGGCGGSSDCGNNNLGTGWIDHYIEKHQPSEKKIEKFNQVLEEFKNKSIQLEITPVPSQ